jgi:glutathione S-transferase
VRHAELRRWLAQQSELPAPALAALLSRPAAWYYARAVDADEAAVRRALDGLEAMLDRADALLADGVLAVDEPNAATLQVLCSMRALDAFADLHDQVAAHPCAAAARRLFPAYPEPVPRFLPPEWLASPRSG